MGCWKGTCFVTNLPIDEDEEVVGLIVKARVNKLPISILINCDDVYTPLPFLLRGKYDDFSCIKDIEANEKNIRELMKYISNFEYVFQAMKKENVNKSYLECLIEALERGKTFEDLLLLMIKKSVFNSIITAASSFSVELIDISFDNLLSKNISNIFLGTDVNEDNFIERLMESRERRKKLKELFSLEKEEFRDICILKDFLNKTRKSFYPPSGAGSQNTNEKDYELLNNLISNELKSNAIKVKYSEINSQDGYNYKTFSNYDEFGIWYSKHYKKINVWNIDCCDE